MPLLKEILRDVSGELAGNPDECKALVFNLLTESSANPDALQEELLCLLGYSNIDVIGSLLTNRHQILREELNLTEKEYLDALTADVDGSDDAYANMSDAERLVLFIMENTGLTEHISTHLLQLHDWDPLVALDDYTARTVDQSDWSEQSVEHSDTSTETSADLQDNWVIANKSFQPYDRKFCAPYSFAEPDKRLYALSPVITTKVVGKKESDLHYMRVSEAEEHVRRTINQLIDKLAKRSDKDRCIYYYHIITGRGLHSSSGPAIKNAITTMLSQNGIRYRINNTNGGGSINATITGSTHYL
ncbi:Smr domain-containing protein [Giardia duodenalis]|uniref:Smr domain-containing protein n=1 Tax=Giardia intestinalis (strain ATCC 50803 / WB clone C6) TaxID=184922 RepID=A8BTU5_GIAIC|nr:Smr domain-containing protein [Giardia intestinalis]KAE8301273.1 Smr domain-containing protein [Giardia intestinalis]|eukprot:XP_001704847.1 Hypothetical protein GL50803_40920 [Giardia lamblia ATCC 50803]